MARHIVTHKNTPTPPIPHGVMAVSNWDSERRLAGDSERTPHFTIPIALPQLIIGVASPGNGESGVQARPEK